MKKHHSIFTTKSIPDYRKKQYRDRRNNYPEPDDEMTYDRAMESGADIVEDNTDGDSVNEDQEDLEDALYRNADQSSGAYDTQIEDFKKSGVIPGSAETCQNEGFDTDSGNFAQPETGKDADPSIDDFDHSELDEDDDFDYDEESYTDDAYDEYVNEVEDSWSNPEDGYTYDEEYSESCISDSEEAAITADDLREAAEEEAHRRRTAGNDYEDGFNAQGYGYGRSVNEHKSSGSQKRSATGKSSANKGKGSAASAKGHSKSGRHSTKRRRQKQRHENKILSFINNSNGLEKASMVIGLVLVLTAVSVGGLFLSSRTRAGELASFSDVGNQITEMNVPGGEGLVAIADAQSAKAAAAEAVSDAATESSTEIVEETTGIKVNLSMASIKQDLKVKFLNASNARLITGIPFQVNVKKPDGSTTTWTDEDKDGIIYHYDIPSGKYTVTIVALEGDQYQDYIFNTQSQQIDVKENITYKPVDVSNEVKTEAEVNAAKEDTKVEETKVESENKDTVEYVESTKTEIGESDETGYTEIDKKTIPDPSQARIEIPDIKLITATESGDTPTQGNETGAESGSGEAGNTDSDSPSGSGEGGTSESGDVGNNSSAGNNGNSASSGEASTSGQGSSTPENSNPSTSGTTAEGSQSNEGQSQEPAEQKPDSKPADGGHSSTTQEPENKPVEEKIVNELSADTSEMQVGSTRTITAKSSKNSVTVTWKSSSSSIEVSQKGMTATLTAKSAGTATITADFSEGDDKEITITVKEQTYTYKIDPTTATIKVGDTVTLKATSEPASASVSWTSSDDKIASVAKGVVTGKAPGTATITATFTNGNVKGTATATITVTEKTSDGKIKLSSDKSTILVKGTVQLKAEVSGLTDKTVIWSSENKEIATVSDQGLVTGVKAGEVKITASAKADKNVTASCLVTVKSDTDILKDKEGHIVFVKGDDGQYRQATAADYATAKKFYIMENKKQYKYTGWQTIDGNRYYFTKDGKPVTGEQVIQGVKYTFDSEGRMSTASGTLGIDVSKWNGSIDWAQVKNSGVSYVIIRCGYRGSSTGALIEDPKFRTNIKGAQAAGLKVGVYFFTQAVSDVEAVEEASMVIELIRGYKISCPVFLDVEAAHGRADGISAATRTAVCKAFCGTISSAGYSTGIYANKTWLNSYINAGELTNYKIWLAQYAAAPTYTKTRYDLWQYSSKGKISGISGNVDMDISYINF